MALPFVNIPFLAPEALPGKPAAAPYDRCDPEPKHKAVFHEKGGRSGAQKFVAQPTLITGV